MVRTEEYSFVITEECAEAIKGATGIDILAGGSSASMFVSVSEYDDDFGAAPYAKADINVEAIGASVQDVERAVRKLLTDDDLWEFASFDGDLCAYLANKGVLKRFCADIDVVEQAINSYTVEVFAADERQAEKIVRKAIENDEVFAVFSVLDERIVETFDSKDEQLVQVRSCNG